MCKKCCGFGHRNVFEPIEDRLREIICDLIKEKDVTEFYIGDMGEFDKKFARVVRLVKREYGNIKLILVKPYFSNRLNTDKEFYNANYD